MRNARGPRQLVVALHVVSSVGWMSQAVALLALVAASATAGPGQVKQFAAWAAEYLDSNVLAFAANASAFTGLLLAAATPWGFVRHWWIAVKLVLTVGQLYAGIFVLSAALHETVAASAVGRDGPAWGVVVGSGLMAGALAVQTWLSVAKPGGRTPFGKPGTKGATAPPAVFVAGIVATVVDVVGGVTLGRTLPVASVTVLLVLAVYAAGRRLASDRDRAPRPRQPVSSSSP